MQGGNGGTATGQVAFTGFAGEIAVSSGGDFSRGGRGAPSFFGGGRQGNPVNQNGNAATIPGGGGSGCAGNDTASGWSGGDGAPGYCVITEFI
jgi:hypothetical protein